MQDGTSGSVSGGNQIITGDEVRLSLLRTGADNVPANSVFFLSAAYTKGVVAQQGITITGE